MNDKIELTEEMVNTLENPPKANNAFKAAAKKCKGEDVKMADVFDLPYADLGHNSFVTDNWDQTKAAIHAINNHDKLTQQVAELKFSLDDRDCYIADADMKNEELAKQVAELRAALLSIKNRQQVLTPSGFEFSSVWQMANKALEESE